MSRSPAAQARATPSVASPWQVFSDSAVWGYSVHVPSFTSEWGFNIATKEQASTNLLTMPADGVLDARIEDRGLMDALKWYDGITHTRMFSLGKAVRTSLAKETRVMTVENPLFMTTITSGIGQS